MSGAALPVIDATSIPADRGGVGRFVDGLIAALGGTFVIVCQKRDEEHFRSLAPTARVIAAPTVVERVPLRLLWEQMALPRIAAAVGATVIHSPHYTVPLATRIPRVVTFHDATFFSDPGVHSRLKRIFFRTWIRLSAQIADAVVADSRSTASELRRYVRMPDEVDVAYLGVDSSAFRPPSLAEVEDFAGRWGLDRWIAFLGTLEPRKNVPALIAALGELSRDVRDPADLPALVLAGGRGWDPGIDRAAEENPAVRVVRTGYLPFDDLPALLGGADVVVYPSLGEGFGLPVLEAMATGAAVLTTSRLAIPEVGGDAVVYSEPDAASIARALTELLDDPDRREGLRRLGRTRAAGFSWEACADAYRRVFARASRRERS